MRKFVIALILFLAVIFVFFSLSELESVVSTLEKSNWIFLTFAVFFECIWLYNNAITYGTLYRLVELQEGRRTLFLMATAANFVNVIMPSAGFGGMAVFVDRARRRGQPAGRVLVAGTLFLLYDYAAFLCVLALGLIVLFRRNHLTAGELTATAILLIIALSVAAMFYLGYRSAERLGEALARIARAINKVLHLFLHRDYLKVENAYEFAREMAEGIDLLRGKKKELLWPFLFTLNNKALLICVLAFAFLSLGTPFSAGTLVGGFSIGYLFLIVSPTPAGVGVVEGVLPVALNSLRVPWAAAVLITLVYRGVTFWFPLAVGGVAFRILQGRKKPAPV